MTKYDITKSQFIESVKRVQKQIIPVKIWNKDEGVHYSIDLDWVITTTWTLYKTKKGKYFRYVVQEVVPEQANYAHLASKKEFKLSEKYPEMFDDFVRQINKLNQ